MNTLRIPEILLPDGVDMSLWAVNACDQFTSDLKYWRDVEKLVGDNPSTLNLIFPEIYLNDNPDDRIANVNRTMRLYLNNGIFKRVSNGFILVERTTESGTRTGIIVAIDLEDYSYEKGAICPVRSTEATILERIPPRVKIRRDACIELPHVMLLYNDEGNSVLSCVECSETLYDFDLNMGGGHVKGTYIKNPDRVIEMLYSLARGQNPLLFAVGDGNHSLATAKTCWEEIKQGLSEKQKQTHPARFALCEIVNIYDKALAFEPIHRLVKTDKRNEFISGLTTEGEQTAYLVVDGQKTQIAFNDNIPDGIRELDNYIGNFIKRYGGEVDYIHGENEIAHFTKGGGVGVILPPIKKDEFFELIIEGGNLPRKTFSMGEGNEKRYYIEAKLIK